MAEPPAPLEAIEENKCQCCTREAPQATLFTQYQDSQGKRGLRKDRALKLEDGRPIDDRIVGRKAHWTESFRAIDFNRDGLLDLFYSLAGAHGGIQDGGSVYLLLNSGTKQDPRFREPTTMCCFGEPIRVTNHGPHAWPGDFDGDGRPDLIGCVEWSVFPFYRHAALMMKERPRYELGAVEGPRRRGNGTALRSMTPARIVAMDSTTTRIPP